MKILFKTILILALLTISLPLWAAEMRVEAPKKAVVVGEEFLVNVSISSKDATNALEGVLNYPTNLLDIKEIRDGASVINFWIEKPEKRTEGEVSFSGITPGGFTGDNNLVFSVLFQAKSIGDASLIIKNIKVLLNDGAGTLASSNVSNTLVSITKGSEVPKQEALVDTELPEDFTPILSSDPNIFDGKYFLVFSTQDKISGIDYYLLREGRSGDFKKSESPYLLNDQTLHKKIFIRAYDRTGNMREVVFNPKVAKSGYKSGFIFAIICLLLVMTYLFRKKLWRKSLN